MFGTESLANLDTCPIAEEVSRDVFWLAQNALLGEQQNQDDILAAIVKIQAAWN
jgi:hypothetical protein